MRRSTPPRMVRRDGHPARQSRGRPAAARRDAHAEIQTARPDRQPRRAQRMHVWSVGRQAGKSTLAAMAAVHNAALRDDLDGMMPRGRIRYVLVAAPAEDQAREFVQLGSALIDGSPVLRSLATVKADRIDFRLPSGARTAIRAMPANSRSVRGLSASLIVMDEFAHFVDTAGPASDVRMFEALEPSTRVFRDLAKVLLISTPFGEQGKFYELFCQARDGLLPSARAVHLPVWEVDTSLGDVWREARRAELGEDVFRQEHGAEFVSGGGSFFDLRVVEFDEAPARPELASRWVCGLDPAFAGDRFGVCVVGESIEEKGVLLVGVVDAIAPGERLRSFARRRAREDRVLDRVSEIIEPYAPLVIATDQHQSDAIASHFGRQGVTVRVEAWSRQSQTAMFTSLRARLTDGSLRAWKHPVLVEDLRRVRARDSETIDLPRHGGGHCDAVSALAIAVWQLRRVSDRPFVGRVRVADGRVVGEFVPELVSPAARVGSSPSSSSDLRTTLSISSPCGEAC